MSSSSAAEVWSKPTLTRFLRRHLWSGPLRTPAETVAFGGRAYATACTLVRAFYVVSFLWVVESMTKWADLLDLQVVDELWPARWIDQAGAHSGIKLVLVGYLVSGLAVLVWPERRIARFAYALFLLQYMAIVNSPTKINHSLHAWLYVSWIFIALPDGHWRERTRLAERFRLLYVFAVAQFAVLFAYTLTGLWKVWEGSLALVHHQTSGFDPSGFSYIIAERLLATDANTIAGPFFVQHELPGWALFVGTMYLESASVVVAFRPRLHKVWGIGLIGFHLGTLIVMGFTFNQNIVLLGLLFILSPFQPERFEWRQVILDLPGIHFFARQFERRRT